MKEKSISQLIAEGKQLALADAKKMREDRTYSEFQTCMYVASGSKRKHPEFSFGVATGYEGIDNDHTY